MEVVATDEWTLLQENDTVDAGVHVRMDLTTGEKWVKRLEQENKQPIMDTALMVQTDPTEHVASSLSSFAEYDYDMMYRTLSKLPIEERERMQLPLQNVLSMRNASPEEIQQFQAQMRHIWEQRQEALRQIEFADFPEILKERIKSLQEYIADPLEHILQNFLLPKDAAIDEADYGTTMITNVVQVLQDLEYHLQDVDMTRDFHTLGGWSLLVSLLENEVHSHSPTIVSLSSRVSSNHSSTETSSSSTPLNLSNKIAHSIHTIQMHAVWAIGTAVKNMQEFYPYAWERIHIAGRVNVTTPVELVLRQLQSTSEEYEQLQNSVVVPNPNDDPSDRPLIPVLQTKLLRLIYGLGALLRGNHPAQYTLIHLPDGTDGTQVLSQQLLRFLAPYSDSIRNEEDFTFAAKFVQRWMNLITDCFVDLDSALLEAGKSTVDLHRIRKAWTSEWCADPVHHALQTFNAKIANNAQNLETLESLCSSNAHVMTSSE
jgi:hypothetical protein